MIQGRKNEQKKGSQPPIFRSFWWGIGSYMLFRLAKSDVIMHSHKYTIPSDAPLFLSLDYSS